MFASRQNLLCSIAVPVALILLSSATQAAPVRVEFTGDVHTTARTGYVGKTFVLGDPNSSEFGLWGLYSKEKSDDPCWVQANSESINNNLLKGGAAKSLCGANGPNEPSMLSADFADTDFTGQRAFVTGVSICLNRDEDKVKGWRLYGKKITDSGTLVDLTTSALAGPRANCHEWQPRVDCPAGELATAAEIHYGPGTEPRSWIGIALKCRALKPTS